MVDLPFKQLYKTGMQIQFLCFCLFCRFWTVLVTKTDENLLELYLLNMEDVEKLVFLTMLFFRVAVLQSVPLHIPSGKYNLFYF